MPTVYALYRVGWGSVNGDTVGVGSRGKVVGRGGVLLGGHGMVVNVVLLVRNSITRGKNLPPVSGGCPSGGGRK